MKSIVFKSYRTQILNCIIFILFSFFLINLASSMPIYVKPLNASNGLIPSTAFTYQFNFSMDFACTNILLSNYSIITTGLDGIGFIDINISSLTASPNYICEYRNGALRKVHQISDNVFNKIYANTLISNNTYSNNICYANGTNCNVSSSSTFNATYQGYNTSYGKFWYNQTYSGSTFNATYQSYNTTYGKYWYNMTTGGGSTIYVNNLTIGMNVSGGGANRVLYENATEKLSTDSKFSYDDKTYILTASKYYGGNYTVQDWGYVGGNSSTSPARFIFFNNFLGGGGLIQAYDDMQIKHWLSVNTGGTPNFPLEVNGNSYLAGRVRVNNISDDGTTALQAQGTATTITVPDPIWYAADTPAGSGYISNPVSYKIWYYKYGGGGKIFSANYYSFSKGSTGSYYWYYIAMAFSPPTSVDGYILEETSNDGTYQIDVSPIAEFYDDNDRSANANHGAWTAGAFTPTYVSPYNIFSNAARFVGNVNLESTAGLDSPNFGGDLWWNGVNLSFYDGTTTHDLLSSSGGSSSGSSQWNTVFNDIYFDGIAHDSQGQVGINTNPDADMNVTTAFIVNGLSPMSASAGVGLNANYDATDHYSSGGYLELDYVVWGYDSYYHLSQPATQTLTEYWGPDYDVDISWYPIEGAVGYIIQVYNSQTSKYTWINVGDVNFYTDNQAGWYAGMIETTSGSGIIPSAIRTNGAVEICNSEYDYYGSGGTPNDCYGGSLQVGTSKPLKSVHILGNGANSFVNENNFPSNHDAVILEGDNGYPVWMTVVTNNYGSGATNGNGLDLIGIDTSDPVNNYDHWVVATQGYLNKFTIGHTGGSGASNPHDAVSSPYFTMDTSGNSQFNGNVYITGSLTNAGGSDPPYELYFNETREDVLAKVRMNVPQERANGLVTFYNKENDRMEFFKPSDCKFYIQTVNKDTFEMQLTEDETIKDGKPCYNSNVTIEYYWDSTVGVIKTKQSIVKPFIPMPKDKEINQTSGKLQLTKEAVDIATAKEKARLDALKKVSNQTLGGTNATKV